MDNVPIASNSDSSPGLISRHRMLDGFLAAVSRADGIRLMQLDPLTTLLVRTHNSVYRITLLTAHRGEVPVQGGTFFAEPTRACLNGSKWRRQLLDARLARRRPAPSVPHRGPVLDIAETQAETEVEPDRA